MAKIVTGTKGKVHEIKKETKQEKHNRLWLEKYELLSEFMNKFGLQKFPAKQELEKYDIKYEPLKNWVYSQRAYLNSGILEDWKYSMLVKAGLDFSPRESRWNEMYDELLEFKRINGHSNVNNYDEGYNQLCTWVSQQRLHKETKSVIQIKKLDDIGFDWSVKRNKWEEMYDRLRNYYNQFGTSLVKIDSTQIDTKDKDYCLRMWANRQIENYKSGYLSVDKVKKLEILDFDFEHNNNNHKNQWDAQFLKLVSYKNKYGDYNVPKEWEEDVSLGQWVARQRNERNFSARWKIDKLNAIGFNWNVNDNVWDKNYKPLKQFYDINGHLEISSTKNRKLYNCVNNIRGIMRGYRGLSLTATQIKLLEEIGLECKPSIEQWYKIFRLLVEFKSKFGHCNVELNIDSEVLYKWCESNRKNKKDLSKNQIKKLNKIGFEW